MVAATGWRPGAIDQQHGGLRRIRVINQPMGFATSHGMNVASAQPLRALMRTTPINPARGYVLRRLLKQPAQDAGILVRSMAGKPLIDGCFRVSIGTTSQMQRFMEAFLPLEQ